MPQRVFLSYMQRVMHIVYFRPDQTTNGGPNGNPCLNLVTEETYISTIGPLSCS